MQHDTIWTGDEPIADYDAAYANGLAVADSASYNPRWLADAASVRERLTLEGRARLAIPYGDRPRQHYDLFLPEGAPAGLVVFVHGGYWKGQAIAAWSHFAGGALARGFAVAIPEYTLCPETTIPAITGEIGTVLENAASEIDGPIRLAGHSAGGHLVSRMLCSDAPIAPATAERIDASVSISGVHDLRPMLRTAMNDVLGLDLATARAESPALLEPREGVRLTCLVGGAELPEFRRQNTLLANAWHGLGAQVCAEEAPGRHHFDIVDELLDPQSDLVAALTAPVTG